MTSLPGLDPLTPTIFHTRWWLDAASGGQYEEAEVHSGGRLVGRLPYQVRHRGLGLHFCHAPELCHALGPAIDAGSGGQSKRNNNAFDVTKQLIAQLPQVSAYAMPLHPGTGDTFAFKEAGWSTRVQFTFLVQPRGEAALWAGLRDKTRNVIRRASERWEVTSLDDPAEFVRMYEANLASRNLRNYYFRIEAVCTAALANNHGRLLGVRGRDGAILAAVLVVWDQRVMYYLLTTRSPDADNSMVSLLVWHCIKMASAKSLVFDFDNVGTPGSRLFFAGFGGTVEPRFLVRRESTAYSCMRWGHRSVTMAKQRALAAVAASRASAATASSQGMATGGG